MGSRATRVAIELCSGMGGIGIGLRELGFRVARAYDSWKAAIDVYRHNEPDTVAEVCDLLSKEGESVVRKACNEFPDVDLLAAGAPCKGFSQLRNGKHSLENPHNRVLLVIPKYVAMLRPRMVLLENVPDLARHAGGETLRSLLEQLARPGRNLRYRVEARLYDAALFGTPQVRRRMIIFAVMDGAGCERLPPEPPDLGPLFTAIRRDRPVPARFARYLRALRDPDDASMVTAAQALSDLPLLEAGHLADIASYLSGPRNAYQRAMRDGAPSMLRNMRTPEVRAETTRRLSRVPAGGCARDIPARYLNGLARRFDSAYRRLHPDAPATALSTRYDCIYHFAVPRSPSVREYARLQGIPDRFEFPQQLVCRRSAYELIGNSVPPALVVGVLRSALDSVTGRRRSVAVGKRGG